MLTIYRRHTKVCKKKKGLTPTQLGKCSCALWLMGTDTRGQYHRESLNTADTVVANEKMRRIDLGEPVAKDYNLAIAEAFERYTAILLTQRGLKQSTIDTSYRFIMTNLLKFAEHKGITLLREVDIDFLDEWVATWDIARSTRVNYMVFITKFFRTAHQRGWIAEDPAALLVKPKGSQRGTTRPFDLASEEPAIMAAVDQWEKGILLNRSRKNPWAASPRTASALLLVLRYTGLRISDAVMFNPRSLAKRTIRGREIYCYFAPQQRKTEAPVFIPIPVAIAERIINAPWISVRYAFWDGVMPLRDWTRQFIQHVLDYLSRVSGVLKIHPHRFRDTFAVDLLSQGADIRSVSRLLGHKDVGTTLRYYEHYVPADQERLIDVVLNHWEGPNVVQFPGAREA